MQVSTGVIRRDGRLELISGRHRFAKMMEDDKVEAHMCYVFIEDAAHDERWATMLDYENNMRDDQADEKTAAVYIRTMPQSDGELYRKGLLRNATKSKRGIFIGRHARQNLFDMFMDDAVSAKDAEVICQLTQNLRDEARVEEIQSRAASLLKDGKSWEYIGAMTQLLANKERVTMRQGLLDLGADFEADLEKMARCIELNMQALKESVGLLKQGRRLSKEKREQAERLGLVTQTSEDSEGKLAALTGELTRWEYIGSYPDLIAAVQMWDGETQPDPVGRVLEAYERERAQAGQEEQRGQGYVPEGQGGFDFSASMVEMDEARERYAGTEAARVIGKVVGGLRAKTKGARSKEELRRLSDDGKIGDIFSHEQVAILPVNERLTEEVAKQTGKDVSLFSHAISEQNIWHAMDGHSNDSVSKEHENQLDLTWEDFDLLPDILDNFNDVRATTKKNGNVKLIYKKSYGDVLYTVIQKASAAQEDGSGTLNFLTEWIKKTAGGTAISVAQGQGMVPSSPGKAIQSQGSGDVKGDFSAGVRNLAAVHTLSVEKFLAAGKMGGMPLPSVAVTRLDRPYGMIDGVDKIVLVGRPEMVDPERGAHVWSKDAWTGMFPKVTRKLTKAGRDAMRDLYYKMGRYDLKSDVYDGRRLAYYRDKFYDAWQKGETPGDMMAMLRSEDGHYIARMLFGMERTGWNGALNEAFAYAHTHDEEFKGWLDEVEGKWFGKLMIEGTRKEATLENVTAWMLRNKKRNGERGIGVSFGTGNARAAVAQRLGSMEEVKARREMLTDSESSDKEKGENDDMLEHVFDMFFAMPHAEGEEAVEKMQERAQRYFEALGRVKGEPTEEKVEKELRKAFANDEQMTKMGVFVTQGVLVLKYLREEAEDYLEAVPQRAVRMDEWVYAVMSKGASQKEEVQRVCRENGITPIVVGAGGKERALGDLIDDGEVSFSVAEAKERGLMRDGVMEAENGVIVDGGTNFDVRWTMYDVRWGNSAPAAQDGGDFSAAVDFSHVSPALYRRPDKEHVGTGEGNQVYGWGVLYGAESPVVNRSYHRQFTRHGGYFVQGLTRNRKRLKREDVLAGLRAHGVWRKQNLDEADSLWYAPSKGAMMGVMEEAEEEVRKWENWVRIAEERKDDLMKMQAVNKLEYWKQEVLVADYFVENDILVERGEVRYPVNYRMRADVDDGNLLHWDEKLDRFLEEHPDVAAAFGELLNVDFDMFFGIKARNVASREGRELYAQLEKKLGSARAASEWLDEHGIRGVKYADGVTRKKEGNKTYNYVIFNPDYVEVIAINNRHEWSEYSEGNPDWQRPEDVDFSASVRNLAAVHTINHDDFINAADELGGMPLPSVAVTRLDRPYSWGDDETSVTLVARPDMVDPRRGTDVYARDAWTGRMPRIESEEDGEDLRTFFYDEEGEKVDATLENLTDYLYGRKRRGNEATERELDLTWTARAYLARRMRDMEDVKGQRERLQEREEVRVLSEDIGKWMDMLHEYDVWLGDDEWIGVFEALADLDEVTEEGVREAIMNWTDADGRADLSALQNSEAMEEGSDFIAETVRIMKELRAEKTDYLEAVPRRAVRMDEWAYALFSDKVGNKESVRRACEENGIIPIEYKAGERDKALGDLIDDGEVSFSVGEAREMGMMKDGVMEAENGVIVDGGTDFSASVDFSHASRALFRKPDREHVGTGEGAQVYGWGYIYGATNPEVNRFYHKSFSGFVVRTKFTKDGEPISIEEVKEELKRCGVDDEKFLESIYETAPGFAVTREHLEKVRAIFVNSIKRDINILPKKFLKEAKNKIAFIDYMLENKVGMTVEREFRNAVNYRMRADVDDSNLLLWNGTMKKFAREHEDVYREALALFEERFSKHSMELERARAMKMNGEYFYEWLSVALNSARAASEWLDAHGIRGVKYADGASRGRKTNKTYNYVIFNPDYIEVIAINNRHEWSEYSEDNPDWERPEEVDFSASVRDGGKRYRVVDDRVGLSEHLNDVVEPVELDVKLTGERKDWMGEARKFFVKYLAKRVLPIGETGFTLHTDGANTPRTSAAKVTTERGARAFERLEEVIGKAVHLGSESPRHREGETKKRKDLMDRSNSVEFFGYPLRVNGGLYLAWFNGTTKKKGKNDEGAPDQKHVRLYEVGFQPVKMKGNAPQLTDLKSDAKGVPLTGLTMAEVLSNVNEKSEWMPEVVEEDGFSAAMREGSMEGRVLEILRGDVAEAEGMAVAEEWEKFLRMFSLSSVGEDEREAGRMLGKMLALVAATRRVLPENFKGGLHGLALQAAWLRWYAQMAETGQVTRSTELSGKVYERVRERLLMQHEREQLSYTEEEAMELLRRYAGQKMGTVVESMARGCRRQVEVYLREKMRQDMLATIERLYPKREPGEHWKRGRATGETYRYAEVVRELLMHGYRALLPSEEHEAEVRKCERILAKGNISKHTRETYERKLENLRRKEENALYQEVEKLEDVLEDAEASEEEREAARERLFFLTTFGGWSSKDYKEAASVKAQFDRVIKDGRKVWAERMKERKAQVDLYKSRVRATKGWRRVGVLGEAIIERGDAARGEKILGNTTEGDDCPNYDLRFGRERAARAGVGQGKRI